MEIIDGKITRNVHQCEIEFNYSAIDRPDIDDEANSSSTSL